MISRLGSPHVIYSINIRLTVPPQRVLDVGTGTGIWAIDFADEFPHTTVSGTDLSPIQPALVPPNCIFEVDDARDLWTYPANYFDFIHIRGLFGSISDWPQLYKQAYKLDSDPPAAQWAH
jgi:ubiquinone/menaquinone biosynthesis C-methylase UbiE